MVFSSILFLFRFMPAAFAIYYLVPKRFKNFTLLVLSLIFYSWGEAKYFPVMIASIVVDYTASGLIESHRDNKLICRLGLIYSVVFNLGMLGFFKYTNFFVGNLNALFGLSLPTISFVLPLGISFYTFQTMSYTIDVYLGKVKAERNIIDFGAFVVLFPQLIAGPIVRYTDINRELKERQINLPQIQDGIKLFILGLGSKVLIANNVGALWTEIEAIGAGEGFLSISTPLAWMAVFAYSLQIYFDFSGYSLMAIGLGKMLGFEFPKNFDFPYISRSFTEFWRRWHMTLGSWFREYLYIPLGGNRVSKSRLYFNLFVVWAATGFWHGASWNFIFWGLFFFVFLVIERMGFKQVLERHSAFSHVYVIFFLLLSWALFAVTDLGMLGDLFTRMFVPVGGVDWIYYLRNYIVVFILGTVLSTPALKGLYLRLEKNNVFCLVFFGAIFLASTAYLVDATYNPFLYFRF
ncbi:MBOAT family protein [Hydrogenoanaerobacterium saccharovorans]|uniref:MBOAT family protein n=1 Tax=Hydrogenoanaerobacterium saccharovorans TaxID=474960 RepID=A0ABS2GP82_9FIRM|nr:MBOAT family O-acyltransferase [Hydrogenoanaerobacterium saccharovorans]MBM6923509.1 MBOAT family protein [Hydrogenoanaerobacterium saccharovorans]